MKNPKQTMYKLHMYFDCYTEDADYNEKLVVKVGTNEHDQPQFGLLLPQTPDWCHTCNGTGGRSQWDINGYDINTMLEDDDGEMREAYFGGKTDVRCTECSSGVIFVIDFDGLSEDQRTILDIEREALEDEAESLAIQAAERRMGC